MNFESIIIAAAAFFIIGIFHPIVKKQNITSQKKSGQFFLLQG